ncbi:carbohydrate ABC transporter permease [Allomesorhizobium camelthorni]|uniref:Carbohydrate ABC transporter permease n=1 Tax=Allomesorhizobium camelthorni TaxID=475069 RepID=A0A6G4W7M9_9HYPH|nr:carbohydrate ABC transporter permease [Mesorhizobium camelthorni]NGO50765.1 carbohydrate ABC transporter permease [Mesorhizobium camelthorni]
MSAFGEAAGQGMSRTSAQHRAQAGLVGRLINGRQKYLAAAVCVAVCTVMLLPLVASVLASLKSTEEAAAAPPTYIPHGLSLDSYERLWNYQAGLPVYFSNSLGAAALTILFCLALTIPAGYGLAKFRIPAKEALFVVLLLGLIVPYQALLTPLFFLFVQLKLHNSLVGLAIVHTAIQLPFSIYVMRNAFEAVPRELEEAAIMDGCNSFQVLVHICLPAVVPAMITVSLFAFITSWNELLAALVIMNKDSSFTLPLILAAARQQTSIGGTDWGMLQAGITISIIPCMAFYLLLQKYYMAGFLSGAVK